jgi:transcription antitermination protein NusB
MISRRLLRVKALQILYAYRVSESDNLSITEKELIFSIEKSYDLYHLILLLLVDISNYAVQRTDIARSKFFPTDEEANPNTRFLDNRIISQISDNRRFIQFLETRKISWSNEEELIKTLYKSLLEWDVYQEYMNNPESSFNHDKKFISRMVAELILPHEYLHQVLEEQSIYWNDDLEFIGSMVIKTFGKWKEFSEMPFLSMFSNDDDRQYVIDLFRKTVLHGDEYKDLIKKFSENWDFERLALMDILIMQMAISEAVNFSSIPAKVTLNEYIEISKFYSTDKSSYFINGILDKIFTLLRSDEKIKKTGRGLIGEV